MDRSIATTIPSAQSTTLSSGPVSTNSGPITLPDSFNNNSVGVVAAGLYDIAYFAPVPGPLPLLGASAAFGWSRRLRRRMAAHRG